MPKDNRTEMDIRISFLNGILLQLWVYTQSDNEFYRLGKPTYRKFELQNSDTWGIPKKTSFLRQGCQDPGRREPIKAPPRTLTASPVPASVSRNHQIFQMLEGFSRDRWRKI